MGRSEQASKRVESLRVRLDPSMMRRFEAVAAERGIAPSTLAAFVLAEYVCDRERTVMQTVYMNEEGAVISRKKSG